MYYCIVNKLDCPYFCKEPLDGGDICTRDHIREKCAMRTYSNDASPDAVIIRANAAQLQNQKKIIAQNDEILKLLREQKTHGER